MSENQRKLRRIQWWKQHKKAVDPTSDEVADSSKPKKFKKSHETKKETNTPADPKPTDPKPTDPKPTLEHEENKTKNRYIIFVGNLPFDLTKDDIIQHFRCAGNADFRMLTKKDTGTSKGCGFLELDDIISYKKALNLHHSSLGGRKINVEVTCGGGGSGEKRLEKLNDKKKKFRKKRAKKQDSTTTDNKEDKKNTDVMIKNEESATNEKMDIKSEKKSKKRKHEFTEEELVSTKKKALKESDAMTAIVKELQLETLLEDKKTEQLDNSLTSDKEGKKKKKKKLKLKEEKD